MEPLLLSSFALLIGPLLARLFSREPRLSAVLDGFLIAALIGLVIVHILPQTVVEAGPLALLTFAIGLVVPIVWERLVQKTAGTRMGLLYAFFIVGGSAHGLLDGAALHEHGGHAVDDHGASAGMSTLALGVILHRFPVGLALYTLVRPMFGNVRTIVLAGAYLFTSAIGSMEATHSLVENMGLALGTMTALIAGSLLHGIVLHKPESTRGLRSASVLRASGVGGILALVFLVVFTSTHPVTSVVVDEFALGAAFWVLFSKSAPVMLLALVIIGGLYSLLSTRAHFLTDRGARSSTTRGPLVAALVGAIEGAPYPLCSCSVEPLYRGVVRGPLSPPAAIAFLVAAPAIGVPAALLTLVFFGAEATVLRVLSALLLAIVAGVIVGRITSHTRVSPFAGAALACAHSERPRFIEGLRYAFVESVDHMGPWFFVGIGVGALLEPLMSPSVFAALPQGLDVLLFALVGAPLYVCAAGMTPLALVLVHKSVTLGAIFALMLAGPACNLGTLRLLRELHGRRIAAAYAAVVVVVAVLVGTFVNAFGASASTFDLHATAGAPMSVLEQVSVAVLVVLATLSLLRQGVRGVLEQVIGGHDHAHDTDGHCLSAGEEHAPSSTRVRLPFRGGARRESARPIIRLDRPLSTEFEVGRDEDASTTR
jgi:uncharacterized membrane protein YraQ (UPF0718 family)